MHVEGWTVLEGPYRRESSEELKEGGKCWHYKYTFIIASMKRQNVFSVPLKAPDDPADFLVSTKHVSGEFATRYLERLGVKPSKSTLDMVHKSVPLTDSCIKTTLRVSVPTSDTRMRMRIKHEPFSHLIGSPAQFPLRWTSMHALLHVHNLQNI